MKHFCSHRWQSGLYSPIKLLKTIAQSKLEYRHVQKSHSISVWSFLILDMSQGSQYQNRPKGGHISTFDNMSKFFFLALKFTTLLSFSNSYLTRTSSPYKQACKCLCLIMGKKKKPCLISLLDSRTNSHKAALAAQFTWGLSAKLCPRCGVSCHTKLHMVTPFTSASSVSKTILR